MIIQIIDFFCWGEGGGAGERGQGRGTGQGEGWRGIQKHTVSLL